MLHLPDHTESLMKMTKDEKKDFFNALDMTKVNFEVKIADFGFSKKLKSKKERNKTICGTPLYMAP